ncbi:hypothetical protein IE53DRAFT_346440 [Violaceomyces palustris]|uniref:Uncharacterized protein n=1 Tax=Violaceomyces palustris TaxID=1673888 RepID=A0ACD0NTE2_9BASI|nr:hypothetical protein IE53DRAFT_346440 [Violaceomyces palustris]
MPSSLWLPEPVEPPLLSAPVSVLACGLFTLSYVGGLYLSSSTRIGTSNATDDQGRPLSKDHPKVIRARLKVACSSTLFTTLATGALLIGKGAVRQEGYLWRFLCVSRLIGFPLPAPSALSSSLIPTNPPLTAFLSLLVKAATYPLLLTNVLYTGPLFVSWLEGGLPFQRNFDLRRDVLDRFSSLFGIRNFILGPLTEEVVFRACVLSITFYSGASRSSMIFATPLYFGIAHLHHAWETYANSGRTREGLQRGLLQAALQFTYTCAFGWYANFLFMRTGTILAPLLSHSFCNIMGLPNPWQASEWYPERRKAIHCTHVVGIVGFAGLLYRLTEPSLFGSSFYWK